MYIYCDYIGKVEMKRTPDFSSRNRLIISPEDNARLWRLLRDRLKYVDPIDARNIRAARGVKQACIMYFDDYEGEELWNLFVHLDTPKWICDSACTPVDDYVVFAMEDGLNCIFLSNV